MKRRARSDSNRQTKASEEAHGAPVQSPMKGEAFPSCSRRRTTKVTAVRPMVGVAAKVRKTNKQTNKPRKRTELAWLRERESCVLHSAQVKLAFVLVVVFKFTVASALTFQTCERTIVPSQSLRPSAAESQPSRPSSSASPRSTEPPASPATRARPSSSPPSHSFRVADYRIDEGGRGA